MNRINRIKRKCALLLAIVMLLGVAFPPGIGGVFAQYTDDATEINEPIAEPGDMTGDAGESTESGDMTGDGGESTEPGDTTGDGGESTEPGDTTGDAGESTEPGETTGEQGEVCPQCGGANGSHSEDCSTLCTCGTETGEHSKDCPLYVCPECGGKQGAHSEGCTALVSVCTCGSETGEHSADCPLYEAPACTCGSESGVHSADCPLYEAPVCTCGSENGVHSTDCPLYEAPACTCGSENGVHSTDCPLYEAPVCTCGSENGVHSEGCPLYKADVCLICGGENGGHHAGCPLYKADVCLICGGENGGHHAGCPLHIPAVCPVCGGEKGEHSPDCTLYLQAVCPECGGKGGNHAETCSQYIAEQQNDPWVGLTAAEFAAWLTDADNGEQVKTILKQDGSQECNALRAHIDQILDGDDQKLAQQVSAYLAALLWLDQVNQLTADTGKTIYFDLAAGNVEIGKNSYSGYVYVYVNGIKTQLSVNGEHKTENQYYIYQSTEANRATTGYHVSSTTMLATAFTTSGSAYGFQSDLTGPSGVGAFSHASYQIPAAMALTTPGSFYLYQSTAANDVAIDAAEQDGSTSPVPEYDRVMHEGQSWTKYITNNTDVKKVSENWDTAAANSQRTPTGNYITFASESGYTANVTIDNIWSTYHHASVDRTTGGIGAHLDDRTDTHIHINLKGDNRVGCVHYSADRGAGNTIEFCNGETGDKSGSITVADFKTNWAANHWNAAIGAADNPRDTGDMSDGIVIHSGVIYAGTTPEDNCTAIGGGGNNYGSVTIHNGTVTAVVSSTGTAIGGGIGYSNKGGDTDVTIKGGTIYAYNLGIKKAGDDGVDGKVDNFANFVPAAAIGGGGSNGAAGNLKANITIEGGTIYAQSMGGPGIGGGCSANSDGGPANITITGGTIIAKSIGGMYGSEIISPGVSIGGGTGKTGGGKVTLNISEDKENVKTILRTGSIGGGKTTGTGSIGNAEVTIKGGNIIGQVVMAGGATAPCSFTMEGGVIHSTNVIDGVKIGAGNSTGITIEDPNPDVPISFIEKNGGAVWMDDKSGIANISGGEIKHCKANNGGVIYMEGGIVNISGGEIEENTATNNGGAVYMAGGTVDISGGSIRDNTANEKGGGVYVGNGTITVSGKMSAKAEPIEEDEEKYYTISTTSIKRNHAIENGGGIYVDQGTITINSGEINYNDAKNGAGMYVGNGTVTMSNGSIHDNIATESGGGMYVSGSADSDMTGNVTINGGSVKFNKAEQDGGGVYAANGTITINKVEPDKGESSDTTNPFISTEISYNTATQDGGGVYVVGTAGQDGATVTVNDGEIHTNTAKQDGGGMYIGQGKVDFFGGSFHDNTAINDGGGLYVAGDVHMLDGSIIKNKAKNGGGVHVKDGTVLMYGGSVDENTATENGGGMYISAESKNDAIVDIFSGSISGNKAQNGGGVSVFSNENNSIHIAVGVNCAHTDLDNETRIFTPFDYPGIDTSNPAYVPTTPENCGDAHENHMHYHIGEVCEHRTCPVVQNNTAEQKGGGFFLDSPKSEITVYCMQARGNQAENDADSDCMEVKGGKLQIGDRAFDTHDEYDENATVKGNTFIEGTIMVEGGQMDVYGEMENPKFISDVKVNVKEASDYYRDHRIKPKGLIDYKVHYYENFKGDGDTPTGLYIARQYPDEKHKEVEGKEKYNFTIMPSMFLHEGYKIVGWDLKPDGLGNDFDVNVTYNLEDLKAEHKLGITDAPNAGAHNDEYLLVIYAIWERCGYVLRFDPNVSEGQSYTGKMEDQQVTIGVLDGSQTISKNQFKRPGYKFLGWTLKSIPSSTDTVYTDGQEIKADFTEEDSTTVTLYAKWERCEHVGYLTYTAKDNVLTETCSKCGGHTANATITAVNVNYDGDTHPATATFSDNWLGSKPALSYEMAVDNVWDDQDKIDDAWKLEENPQPLHAGSYTAKLTVSGATAQKKYTISPIKWETPEVPQISFKVEKNTTATGDEPKYNSVITITTPTGGNLMYKITHLPNGGTEQGVEGYSDWQSANEFSNIPYGKYYYFYAKRIADRDHIESDPSKSAAYLTTGGNIIYIENGEGIQVVPQYGGGSFNYTVSAAEGYHLRGYQDNLTSDNMTIGPANKPDFVKPISGVADGDAILQDGGITITRSKSADETTYTYTVNLVDDLVTYHQITLQFSGAAKNATVSHKVTDGQVFSDFNSKETSISRDSSFTAQFTVKNYIPDEYSGQELKFSQVLPEGSTIIMKADGRYWYHKLGKAATEATETNINLTEFIEMGGKAKFSFDTVDTTAKTFTYQFIVDFSQTIDTTENRRIPVDSGLDVSLKLTADDKSHSAPDIPADGEQVHISLGLATEATFGLSASVVGKTTTVNYTYTPSDGAASIWNDRETALVLTAPATVPADLTVTTVIDGSTTRYAMKAKTDTSGKTTIRQFIIPLGELGSKKVQVTLNSALFDSSEERLTFTAQWYVAQGRADQSPLNGHEAASSNVTFSCQKDAVPSVRIDGTGNPDRLIPEGGKLTVKITYAGIPSGHTVTAYLQRKKDGQYDYTGAKNEILSKTTELCAGSEKVTFEMGELEKGSYRILVDVLDLVPNEQDENKPETGANILQVPYYFVIE